MSRKKELRPMWTTTVDPSEYDYQDQFADCVKIANREETWFLSMDIGKVWGLVQSHVRLERENAELERENAALKDCLDWAESILCNSLPMQHSTLDEWNEIINKWRDSKHAIDAARKETQP